MKKRTQLEVNALWPKNRDRYTITAYIKMPSLINNKPAAINCLKPLFQGYHAVAGMFCVEKLVEQNLTWTTFEITFERDVPDDFDVVNEQLLQGKDFHTALIDQLKRELKNAILDTGYRMLIHSLSKPEFKKVRFKLGPMP